MRLLRQDEKGMATAELLFVTILALFIIGSMVSIITSGMEKTQTGSLGEVRAMGEKIAETINIAHTNGDGYSLNINIPPATNGYPYLTAQVTNVGGSQYLKVYLGGTPTSGARNVAIKLIPNTVQTSVANSGGNDYMTNGYTYTVSNNNGTISIKQGPYIG